MLRTKPEDKAVAVCGVSDVSDLAARGTALLEAILRECRTRIWPVHIDLHNESRSEAKPPQTLDRDGLLDDFASAIPSPEHQWVARAQTLEAALAFRLRAAGEPASPASLMQALAESTEADLTAMLLLDEVDAVELAALREFVHARLNLSTRKSAQVGGT